jgi:tetratricopeptide (TPR) repeat protein
MWQQMGFHGRCQEDRTDVTRHNCRVDGSLLLALFSVANCDRISEIRATKSFKDGNEAHKGQDYKRAAELYEQALQARPDLNAAYFCLENSYDNLWKPSRKREAADDSLLDRAVENYEMVAERPTIRPKLSRSVSG